MRWIQLSSESGTFDDEKCRQQLVVVPVCDGTTIERRTLRTSPIWSTEWLLEEPIVFELALEMGLFFLDNSLGILRPMDPDISIPVGRYSLACVSSASYFHFERYGTDFRFCVTCPEVKTAACDTEMKNKTFQNLFFLFFPIPALISRVGRTGSVRLK